VWKQLEITMKNSIFFVATAAIPTVLGLAISASATTDWGPLTAPGNTPALVDVNPDNPDFVTFYGSLDTSDEYAGTYVTSYQGGYSTSVSVVCRNGSTNSNTSINGNVIVACPFFSSTVAEAVGSGTAN
jgi:hypothetical protein